MFQDRELAPDHRYYYRVAAYDQDGYLGLVAHPEPCLGLAAPGAPGPQGGAGRQVVALSWPPGDPTQNSAPTQDLAGYLIWRRSARAPGLSSGPSR